MTYTRIRHKKQTNKKHNTLRITKELRKIENFDNTACKKPPESYLLLHHPLLECFKRLRPWQAVAPNLLQGNAMKRKKIRVVILRLNPLARPDHHPHQISSNYFQGYKSYWAIMTLNSKSVNGLLKGKD